MANEKHTIRVLVLGTRGIPDVLGGVEKHCEELYPRLVEMGCAVTVCTRTCYIKKDLRRRMREWKGVKLVHLWCPKHKAFEAFFHTLFGVILGRFIHRDLIHIHGIGPSLMVPIARMLGMKTIITHHGQDYNREKWGIIAKTILRLGEYLGCKFANHIISVSAGTELLVRERYKRESTLTPTAVNSPTILPPGDTLKHYNLKPHKYILSSVRLVPEKGVHDLINAYKEAYKEGLDAQLVITGDADHETTYSRHIKKSVLEEKNIIMTGFITRKKLEELYSNAGLFVLPSYHEGLSMALLEALSYSIPVLASNILPNREVGLDDSRYFKAGDVKDLKKKLIELMARGILEQEKSFINDLLIKKHSWTNVVKKTYEAYLKAIE